MRLVVCGGGTGGHAFPAIQVGYAAVSQGCDVLYIGSKRGIEGKLVGDLPLPFARVSAEPVGSPFTPRGIRGLLRLARARSEASHLLSTFQPDIVFGTGGYAAAPVLMAQRSRGGQYVLHEQNAVAGRANRMMGRSAAKVCLMFERARESFRGSQTVVTGMPIRDEVVQCDLSVADARTAFGLDPDKWTVFVYGGSQGAQAINEAVLAAAQFMSSADVQWLHVAGVRNEDVVRQSAARTALNGNYVVRGFLNGPEVGTAFRAASMAITRCGASTLTECLAWGLPSIMVPLPTAAANHQYYNAKELADAGAGVLIRQPALVPEVVARVVNDWRGDQSAYDAAAESAKALFRPNATQTILEILYETAGRRNGVGTGGSRRKVS